MVAVTTTTATAANTETVWQIDPSHSAVEFGVKHMMFSTVKGRFGGVSGRIVVDGDDPATGRVEVEIEAASVDTRDGKRDAHLRSADFFDAENHPSLRFRSTRIEPVGGDRFRLVGDLTIRGVTKEVVLEATFNGRGTSPWGQEVAGYSAETAINRKDYGLTWSAPLESGGVLVGDDVKISLEIEASRQV
jgi:polyisoprenoid-binding protein YceI